MSNEIGIDWSTMSAAMSSVPSYFFGGDIARQVSKSYEDSIREFMNPNLKPKRIVSIDNKTIKCVFKDGKEVFVTVQEPDIFDENIGVALAVCTKMFGSKTKFMEYVAEIIERPTPTEKKKKKAKKA
jgi:hypothetical protein